MIAAILSISFAISAIATYKGDTATKVKAACPSCDDVFFCQEGWVYRGTGPDGEIFYSCDETRSWIICTSQDVCVCYHSEECYCPPVSDLRLSPAGKAQLDALIEKHRKERKEKP
jgi:hypothetical protein